MSTNKELLSKWYSIRRELIPQTWSEFGHFAGNGIGLMPDSVFATFPRFRVSISLTEPTASWSPVEQVLTIPTAFFSNDFITKLTGEIEEDEKVANAAVLVNGAFIHECGHIIHTPVSMLDTKSEGLKSIISKYGEKLSHIAINVVEDIYIEARMSVDLSTSFVFLAAANKLLFSEKSFEKVTKMFLAEPKISTGLNLLINYKLNEYRKQIEELVNDEIVKCLKELTIVGKLLPSTRVNIAERILDALSSMKEASESSESDEKEDSEGEGSGEGEGSENYDEDADEVNNTSASEEAVESAKTSRSPASKVTSDFSKAAKEVIRRKMLDSGERVAIGEEISVRKMKRVDVLEAGDHAFEDAVTFNRSAGNFVSILKALRTSNTVPGIATVRGPRIVGTRLSRIATDNKIFSYAQEVEHNNRIEIVILVDLSGSTSGSLAESLAQNAKNIFLDCRTAGIACSVVGHTSFGNTQPVLIECAHYDMKTTSNEVDRRFRQFSRVTKMQNYDGLAIAEASKLFTGRPARRIIISLSDGTPQSTDYGGSTAIAHTKREIEKARKSDIIVFSISVIKEVVDANNDIYGENWNVDGSANLTSQFEALVKRIVSQK